MYKIGQVCYNRVMVHMYPEYIKHFTKGEIMGEEGFCLPYNKYGEWDGDTWIPYDDMGEVL